MQPGHRLMVQVQSSWFPLYDRNPQTYVPNIFFAKPADYRAATQKVFTGAEGTWIGLPVVTAALPRSAREGSSAQGKPSREKSREVALRSAGRPAPPRTLRLLRIAR